MASATEVGVPFLSLAGGLVSGKVRNPKWCFFSQQGPSDDPRPVSDTIPLLISCQVARVTKSRNDDDKKERHEERGPKSDCFHCVL